MTEKPISFNTEMVKAILGGRKTQTRRIIKNQPNNVWRRPENEFIHPRTYQPVDGLQYGGNVIPAICPFGSIGDTLWVRETWLKDDDGLFYYKADPMPPESEELRVAYGYKWKPSIHMPREACRLFLKVTNVRVERLQEITEDNAKAEGFGTLCDCGLKSMVCENCMNTGYSYPPVLDFMECWDSIYALRGFGSVVNPWVWVIEFEKINKER